MENVPDTQPAQTGTAAHIAAAEAHHRIANSLALLSSIIRLQTRAIASRRQALTDADARLLLDGLAGRLDTIGQLHRLLSRLPQEERISLLSHLREIRQVLVAAFSSAERCVTIQDRGPDCTVPVRFLQPLLLILCEIVINALKYAHPAGVPLVMWMDCASAGDGRLVLTISDDGDGLPAGFDPLRDGGLGFRVIRSLAAEIGATLTIQSSGLGLCFRLSLPARAMPGGAASDMTL